MTSMEATMTELVLISAAVPVVIGSVGWIAVRLVRWARKNRARSAAMMAGDYLDNATDEVIEGDDGDLLDRVTDWLGAKNVRRYAVQFREQVWPGDAVVCSGAITRKYEENGERKVDVDLLCTRVASGGAAIKGEATFVVP